MPCTNIIDCCPGSPFTYDSTVPDPAPEPPEDTSCPACTEDVVGTCVLQPPDVEDLDTWLKAYTAVFHDEIGVDPATNGETVGLWEDQSGQGLDMNSSVFTPGMTYHTNVKNGLPVIRSYVVANGSGVETGGSLLGFANTFLQPEVFIAALRFRTDPLWPADRKRLAIGYNGSATVMQIVRNGDGTIFMGQMNATTGVNGQGITGGSVALDEFFIIAAVFDGANSWFRINNGPKVEGDVGSLSTSSIVIGGRTTLNTISDSLRVMSACDYCEIAKFSTARTDAQIFGVTNYLSQTWAIPIV